MRKARRTTSVANVSRSVGAKRQGDERRAWPTRAVLVAVAGAVGCSHAAPPSQAPVTPVAAAAPPKDDGKPSEGANGGGANVHAAALEQLKSAKMVVRDDKQHSVRVPLPDGRAWTRVKFWGVTSLVGFRYGKDHHAIVGATVTHVDDPTSPGACRQSFEEWAKPLISTFDVEIEHEPPGAFVWNGQLVEVESLTAHMATLLKNDAYSVAFGAYPMPQWQDASGKRACLIVGVAVPASGEAVRAQQVRDRFATEALPKVRATAKTEPPERY